MSAQENTIERTFKRGKETKNKVVFEEQTPAGQPPIVETIYVSKWWAGEAQSVNIRIVKG